MPNLTTHIVRSDLNLADAAAELARANAIRDGAQQDLGKIAGMHLLGLSNKTNQSSQPVEASSIVESTQAPIVPPPAI